MEYKPFWRSLTIIALLVIIGLILLNAYLLLSIKPLKYDFTTKELCDWAYLTSRNQRILIIQMLNLSCALMAIYGRKRARKGIGGKNEKG